VNITNFFASSGSGMGGSVGVENEIKTCAVEIPAGVVTEYCIKTELNPGGLKRAKKERKEIVTSDGKKKSIYQNEDEYVTLCPYEGDSSKALFCIFDGHADKNAAVAAKKLIPSSLHKEVEEMERPYREVRKMFEKVYVQVDKEMSAYEYEGCTCTSVFCWTEKNGDRFIQSANVGDSSAILCRGGKVIALSFDHKLKDNAQEQQRLRELGVEITDNQSRLHGLAITRTLGDHCLKKGSTHLESTGLVADPYVSDVISIQSGDILLLASDGLWDVMTFEKAAEMICTLSSSSEMVRKLMNQALGNTECRDNVTIICSVF